MLPTLAIDTREPLPGVPELVFTPTRHRAYYGTKRLLDVTVSLVVLILASPLLALIAIAVRLESDGPALLVQDRVGARRQKVEGRHQWSIAPYRHLKFRTMVKDADPTVHRQHMAAYIAGDERRIGSNGANGRTRSYKLQDDSRITRVGRVLRQTSLDELPQLLSVLKGDMSLVGPRPLLAYEVTMFDTYHMARFGCQPGITGLAQVDGRCTLRFEEMITRDLKYVDAASLRLDLRILLRTVPVVISRDGAG